MVGKFDFGNIIVINEFNYNKNTITT